MTKPEKINLECPFCHQETISAFYIPSVLQAATSRSAAKGSVTKFYRTKEKYEITSGCSNCGKSLKEVKKKMEGSEKEKEDKVIERLKKQGLFIEEIKSKV